MNRSALWEGGSKMVKAKKEEHKSNVTLLNREGKDKTRARFGGGTEKLRRTSAAF